MVAEKEREDRSFALVRNIKVPRSYVSNRRPSIIGVAKNILIIPVRSSRRFFFNPDIFSIVASIL